MFSIMPRARSVLIILGGLSLVAVIAGVAVCYLSGIPAVVWARNLIAWLIGGVGACVLWRGGVWLLPVVLVFTALLVGGSFFGPEQMGIHRWINAGPVSLNVAMLTLPAALLSLVWLDQKSVWPWAVVLAITLMLAMQPDRSQAAAFGTSVVWLAARSAQRSSLRIVVALVTVPAIAGAWLQPDPLLPVPEVEQILSLAYTLSPVLAVLALVSLLLFSIAPAFALRNGDARIRRAGEALTIYFLICTAMPFAGAYPVPLVGMGMSSILGGWFAVGLLASCVTGSQSAVPAKVSA